MIMAVVLAVFAAAALTPAETYAKTSEVSVVNNIAKVDYENRTIHADTKMIADNEIPLAAAPVETGINSSFGWLILAASAIISGLVIQDDLRDRRSRSYNPHRTL